MLSLRSFPTMALNMVPIWLTKFFCPRNWLISSALSVLDLVTTLGLRAPPVSMDRVCWWWAKGTPSAPVTLGLMNPSSPETAAAAGLEGSMLASKADNKAFWSSFFLRSFSARTRSRRCWTLLKSTSKSKGLAAEDGCVCWPPLKSAVGTLLRSSDILIQNLTETMTKLFSSGKIIVDVLSVSPMMFSGGIWLTYLSIDSANQNRHGFLSCFARLTVESFPVLEKI